MAGNFDDVICGIRMRLLKKRNHHFVDPLAASRIDQFPKHRSPRLQRMLQPQHRLSNRSRLRPRQSDHTDPSASRRSGNRNDRIVEVHEKGF